MIIIVSSGVTSTGIILSGLYNMKVLDGGTVNSTTISGGSVVVSNGGTASCTTISGGSMSVLGGTANSTTISGGSVVVSNGGTASNTTISGGSMSVLGGTADNTTISGGSMSVLGGTADNTTISNGSMMVSRGTANSTTVNTSGRMYVYGGGAANDTTVNSGGKMYVFSGGTADSTTLSGGWMRVNSGGTATNVIWTPCVGRVDVDDGAVVTYQSSYSGVYFGNNNVLQSSAMEMSGKTVSGYECSMYVFSEGTANSITVKSGGKMYVYSGGTANSTTLNSVGYMDVSSGGTANSTTVNSGGYMVVSSGGTANSTTNSGGYINVTSGGTANSTTVNVGGDMMVDGGTANSTTVNSSGCMAVYCGGTANSTTNSGGYINVTSGGTANSTTTLSGGRMYVSSGGILSGSLQIASGAVVSAYQGAIIDFTVAEQAVPATALVNDWSLISGRNDADYTITVDVSQADGTYSLADGAADFNQTITVKNTEGTEYGTLSAGETKGFGGKVYTLAQDADSLALTIITPAVSDYNGSGRSDMVQFVNGLVYVTYDTDSGYVQTPAINDITGWNVVEIRRDLTGDGFADIQITSDDGYGSTWVATLRNDYLVDGCITLNYQFIGAYDNQLWSYLGSADFNADGKSEILMIQTDAGKDPYGHRNVAAWVTDSTTCEWIDNIWLGSLNDEWDVAGTADVTGDGADNVLLRRSDGLIGYWSEAGTNNIVELKNAGERVLLTTGDFDGDGASDFLWKSLNGDEYSVWTDLSGTFSDETIGKISDLGGNWSFAGVGDYNGDGMDELLWCDTTTYQTAYSEGSKENFAKLTVIV